jgi:heme/copper-type cytochrome/quinol oxidase subunit 3
MKNLLAIILAITVITVNAQTNFSKEDNNTRVFASVLTTAGVACLYSGVKLYLKPIPAIYNNDGTENSDKFKANYEQQRNNSLLIASAGVFFTMVGIFEFKEVAHKKKKLTTEVGFNSIRIAYAIR